MTTPTTPDTIEYALMVNHGEGETEYIPATSADHAERMARTIYAGYQCWTVGRKVQPWRFVRRADAKLTDLVSPAGPAR